MVEIGSKTNSTQIYLLTSEIYLGCQKIILQLFIEFSFYVVLPLIVPKPCEQQRHSWSGYDRPEHAVVAGETHCVSNLVHFRTPPIWSSTHVKDAVMMRIITGIAFYVIMMMECLKYKW